MSKERVGQRHKNRVYFKDPELDFYLQAFSLGYSAYGGASIGEIFFAASRINEKDLNSWVEEWGSLARTEARADASAKKGHRVSARDQYLRAFTYYRAGISMIRAIDPRFGETYERLRSCFSKAARLFSPPIEPVEIPYEGTTLPGYFMKVDDRGTKRPTVIVIGGGDTFAEDLYFWGGAAGISRGYNIMMVDLPGQGATALKGLHYRPDVEVPIKLAVDYVLSRPDVDEERLAIFGVSLGGYIVIRSAAYEKRIKACAASTPISDFHKILMDSIPAPVRVAPGLLGNAVMKLGSIVGQAQLVAYEKFFEWQVGASTLSEALEKIRHWNVDVSKITCPVLCMVGMGEGKPFKDQAAACYEVFTGPKEMRNFTEEEGADAHCQANNLRLGQEVLFDWLDELFIR